MNRKGDSLDLETRLSLPSACQSFDVIRAFRPCPQEELRCEGCRGVGAWLLLFVTVTSFSSP